MNPLTASVQVLRADNPGPMTLDGTRSVVLQAPGSSSRVVVDPGPDDGTHLRELAAAPVELVLITHRHADHTAGSATLRDLTGAPVRAADPEHCHGAEPLRDGEVITRAGVRIEVLATPGHTGDSMTFVVTGPDEAPVVLTGDTVLGRGTTVIAEPDGSLSDYLASLDLLEEVGDGRLGVPAHGPEITDLGTAVRAYREHRLERLDQVRDALDQVLAASGARPPASGDDVDDDLVDRVTSTVYADVDPSVVRAARQSVRAQLVHLAGG